MELSMIIILIKYIICDTDSRTVDANKIAMT